VNHLERSRRNWFAANGLWRAGERRRDDAWILSRFSDATARIVPVWQLKCLVALDEPARAVLLPAPVIDDANGPTEVTPIFLGERGGHCCFAYALPDAEPAPEAFTREGRFHDLREVGGLLEPEQGALLAYARAMVYWHRRHCYCGECGAVTASRHGGHQRECTGCGAQHFPRIDPAVIMCVTHDDRCLLGRQRGWPDTLYSTLAGFVEPGETIEETVVREVREEVGVEVDTVEYHSSQPWPFPSSLMLGFTAHARDTALRIDPLELEDARWFTRAQIVEQIHSGALHLPRRHSIAFRLIEEWFDAGSAVSLAGQLP